MAKNYHELGMKIPAPRPLIPFFMGDFMKIAGKIAEEAHWITFAQKTILSL